MVQPALDQGVGYGVVIGLGALFAFGKRTYMLLQHLIPVHLKGVALFDERGC